MCACWCVHLCAASTQHDHPGDACVCVHVDVYIYALLVRNITIHAMHVYVYMFICVHLCAASTQHDHPRDAAKEQTNGVRRERPPFWSNYLRQEAKGRPQWPNHAPCERMHVCTYLCMYVVSNNFRQEAQRISQRPNHAQWTYVCICVSSVEQAQTRSPGKTKRTKSCPLWTFVCMVCM
jgi:hypothetical protein